MSDSVKTVSYDLAKDYTEEESIAVALEAGKIFVVALMDSVKASHKTQAVHLGGLKQVAFHTVNAIIEDMASVSEQFASKEEAEVFAAEKEAKRKEDDDVSDKPA